MMNLAFCIPFAGLLLCIAVLPLVKAEWWEAHQPHAVVFWSLLFVLPFAFVYGPGQAFEKVLECIVDDYLTFIILLFGLFCVSGNITLEGDLAGSPRINVGLLLIGTMLSSWIGTTGASMLMVRPVIKMNAWRKRRSHIMVFFIFLISNIGGCLTPIGDPPLLMGFMRGVPFFWSLHLLPVLLFNVVILLTVFYFLDLRAYRKDIAEGLKPDISKPGTEVHIMGLHNLVFLVMIIADTVISLVGKVRYRTEIQAYERLMKEDWMTGMQSREPFENLLAEMPKTMNEHKDILLVFMDIDYLRRINNDFGRAAGDEVIVAAARCIENVFGAIGKCYRTGGDEFAAVVFDPEEDRNTLSEKLDKEIRRYNRNSRYRLSISRGFSSIRDDRGKLKTTGEWKYEADTNMYQNKMKERKTHEL